jgi:ABC-type bacteriocin/lantibiotic exporter with double-glycine peptidase domain
VRAERAATLGLAFVCALGASLSLAGCYAGTAHTVTARQIAADPGWLVVPDVPLIRQSGTSDCGAAALAMVLAHWQRPIPLDEITARDPAASSKGWKAGQLRDLARERGLQSFVVSGQLGDLNHEISQGRPVMVGVVKRYGDKALAHYEVVIGIHREKRRILTLDPADGWREDSLEGFAKEWVPTKQVTLVFLAPS